MRETSRIVEEQADFPRLLAVRIRHGVPFGLLIVLSLFFVARDPGGETDLIDLAPASADWISLHANAPTLAEFFLETGDKAESEWVRQLFPGNLLVARVTDPLRGPSGWILLSRVGPRHARLRLLATFFGVDGFDRMEKHRGRLIYYRESREENEPALWAALGKGVLILGVDSGPEAVRRTLDRIDGIRPGFGQVFPLEREALAQRSRASDRGIWRRREFPERRIFWHLGDPEPQGRLLHVSGFRTGRTDGDAGAEFAARLAGGAAFLSVPLPQLHIGGFRLPPGTRFLMLGPPFTSNNPHPGWPGLVWMVPDTQTDPHLISEQIWAFFLRQLSGRPVSIEMRDRVVYFPPEADEADTTTAIPGGRGHEGWFLFSNDLDLVDRLRERWNRPEALFETRHLPHAEAEILGYFSGVRLQELYGQTEFGSGFLPGDFWFRTGLQRFIATEILIKQNGEEDDVVFRISPAR